jgi:hypothetical protein
MLGYVLDGDMAFAISSVHAAIDANKSDIGLSGGPDAMAAIAIAQRFSTDHLRPGSESAIHVRHSLLPFPVTSKAKGKSNVSTSA